MAGVMKYLLVLAVLALAIMLWLRRQRRVAPSASPLAATEAMTRCAHCGLHLPQSQALRHKGQQYCCAAHRDLHQ